MKHRVEVFLVILLNIQWAASTEQQKEPLCSRCTCADDPSTWTVTENYGEGNTTVGFQPDSDALLVNCSGASVYPFAGAYMWPDIPLHAPHEEEEVDPKLPSHPSTRADFSYCGLSGAVKKLPTKETRRLRELSLAHNSLSWIDSGAFMGLPSLQFLNLEYNKLAAIPEDSLTLASDISLASNIRDFRINHNELTGIPWTALQRMPKLDRLDVSNNHLTAIEEGINGPGLLNFKSGIKVLIIKHNQLIGISTEDAERFPALVELDLSWNKFHEVPGAFLAGPKLLPVPIGDSNGTKTTDASAKVPFPNLKYLNLDGNPIKILGPHSFVGALHLRSLSLSSTNTLVEVSSEAFAGLLNIKSLKMRKNVMLSHLPKKGLFHKARENEMWTLDEVDLSYNSLEYISEEFLPWMKIRRIDLQGNPWNCNCSLQWMLDDLMPYIYKNDSSLLVDLRCSKPRWLQGRRFVHWLGHSTGVYCGGKSAKLKMENPVEVNDVEVVAMGMNTGMLTTVVAISVLVLGLVIAAVVLQRRATRKEKDLRTRNFRCRNPRF